MKKSLYFPVLSAAGGLVGLFLRLLQNRAGYEAATGLPLPGAAVNLLFPLFLAAMAVVLYVLARSLPKTSDAVMPQGFMTDNTLLLTVAVGGIFLMGISGALEFLTSFPGGLMLPGPDGLVHVASSHPQSARICGILSVVSAVALFPAIAACRRQGDPSKCGTVNGTMLLIPTVCLVIRLVFSYRIHYVNPVLSAYFVNLLALVFLVLGYYRLSSFAFSLGRPRLFALYSGASVVLALTNLADGIDPAAVLYVGGSAALLAFLVIFQSQPDASTEA